LKRSPKFVGCVWTRLTVEGPDEATRTQGRRKRIKQVLAERGLRLEDVDWAVSRGAEGKEALGSRSSTSASRRLNVVFSEAAYDALKELADQSGKTISDVVRDAIALQRWFNDVRKGGDRVLVEERGRVREIINIR
jgi:hypothetical protein